MTRHKKAFAISAALVCAQSAYANLTLLDKDEWKFSAYGFAETDAIVDSTRSLGEVTGNTAVDRPGTYNGDNGRTQFSIRNSRLGFVATAPKAGDWATKGVMEFDFLGTNGGSGTTPEATLYNNPVMRARHFYLQAEASGWQLLAGQYWTLFGWQPGYFPASLTVAPISGVLYQRTAQFTAIKNVDMGDSRVSAGVSVVRPAQRDSQIPGLDAGLRWEWRGRKSGFVGMTSGEPKAQPMSVGVSGRLNQFVYNGTSDTSTTTHMMGSALAVDTLLPIIGSSEDSTGNTLSITGEFTTGQGYGEAFPGWTGNLQAFASSAKSPATSGTDISVDAGQLGFDSTGGIALVHLTTFNLQLQYHLPADWMTFVTTGYGQLYSNNIDTLTGGTGASGKGPGPIYDRDETFFFNVGHNFGKSVRLAAEYDYIRTTYSDGVQSHNNRYQMSAFFYF